MATAEQQRSTEIQVENPATGEVVGSVAGRLGRGAARDGRARPRGAARLGGARVRRAREGPAPRPEVDDRQRGADRQDDRRRVGQDLRGRAARRGRLRRQRVRLLGQARARVPGRRARALRQPVRARPQARRALPPARAGRRDRAVELPADELVRRLHPRDGRRQRRDPQAGRGDPHDLAADAGVHEGVRPARGHLPGRPGQRLQARPRADRPRRHDHVHRLDGDRQEDHGARVAHAHPGLARARRQGPDDRARRRRHRARRQRGHLLLDAERRPDLHLGRARLRRGADLRRVRRGGSPRRSARCARACPAAPAASTWARSPTRPRSS